MPRHAALRPALTFAAALIFAASAHAIPKTYVARAGSDVNACTDAAPCRTFAGAIAKTDVGGEIVVLDAGEYGPVSITKSIRITAEGVYAGVRATSAVESAIDVNLASIGVVVLRGLSISSRGAKNGIHGSVINTLYIENCTITGVLGTGILFTARGNLFVKDTIVRGNGQNGIMVSPGGAYTQTALVDHCRLENNPYGLIVSTLNGDGTATVTVRNTVAANKREGFYAQGSRAQLNVFDSEAVHHSLGSGFHASGGAKINAQHCISSNNAYGFFAGGGVINAKDCTAAYNNGSGMQSTGLGSKLSAEGCQLVSNFTGLHVAFDATAIISDTLVTGNNIGLKNDPAHPGVLESFGNNRVRRNTDGTQGTITTAPQM